MIGTGLARTGSNSLLEALEELTGGEVHTFAKAARLDSNADKRKQEAYAEAAKEADAEKRTMIDAKNDADSLIYNTEKQL